DAEHGAYDISAAAHWCSTTCRRATWKAVAVRSPNSVTAVTATPATPIVSPQRRSGRAPLPVLPQTPVRPARQQPLPPPSRPPAPAGQQTRSRLPPRRQSHPTDRRSTRRLTSAPRLLNSSCL